MARAFRDLVKNMPASRQKKIRQRTQKLLHDITLQELRQALELTQTELAETLDINQAAVSKMENQSDMYISTLRRFVEAMGGSLEIIAKFPGGEVSITELGAGEE